MNNRENDYYTDKFQKIFYLVSEKIRLFIDAPIIGKGTRERKKKNRDQSVRI